MFHFQVKPDGAAAFSVTAETRDVVAWEKFGKNRSMQQLTETMRMSDMYALAHTASVRKGMFAGDLATFEATVDLDFTDQAEPDPTQPGASPGES